MPSEAPPVHNHRLTSWKEIAQFFGRDARTVQRWEKEEGLPVHRHMHQRQSSVYAYPEELEAWWRERGSKLLETPLPAATTRRFWPWVLAGAGVVVLALLAYFSRNSPAVPSAPESPSAYRTILFQGSRPEGGLLGALAGDFNGDGHQDLVLTASSAREVYIIFGGSLTEGNLELPQAAGVVFSSPRAAGLFVSGVGDFNGDSIDDLLLSQDFKTEESFRATAPSFLIWGRRQWPRQLALPQAADVVLRMGWITDARLAGCNPTRRSDLNGDGLSDVLLGAPEYGPQQDRKAAGSVFALLGRRTWPRELEIISVADLTLRGPESGAGFGMSCSTGDFNHDGRDDVAVVASESTLWDLLGGKGKTYLFFGRKEWPRLVDAAKEFDVRVEGTRTNSNWTASVLADVNGDEFDDLILGLSGFADAPGEIRIWFGSPQRRGSLSADAADVTLRGSSPGAQLGHALVAADFDRDGTQDLVLSEPGRGSIYFLSGRRNWKRGGTLADFGAVPLFQGLEGTGASRMATGDVNGDLLPEVVFSNLEAGGPARGKCGRVWALTPYLPLRVDLQPESGTDRVLYPEGLCAARVYESSSAEAGRVDPSTLRLGSVPPADFLTRDYNGDGLLDVQANFPTTPLRLKPGTQRLALVARARNGRLVAGLDSVAVVTTEVKNKTPLPGGAPSRR